MHLKLSVFHWSAALLHSCKESRQMRTSKQSAMSASRCSISLQVAHRFLRSSKQTLTISLFSINRQGPVIDMQCVFCDVGS